MVNLREVYRTAEQHTTAMVVGLFALLGLLLIAQSVFSPLLVLAGVISIIFLVMTFARPLWTLAVLALYLPFEPFLLKFTPDEIFLFARFFSETLIYLLAAVTIWYVLTGRTRMRKTPVTFPFVLFVLLLIVSAVINLVPPAVAVLGMRQILRFVIVFFIAAYLFPPKRYIRKLTLALFAVAIFQAGLGIAQAVIGAPLDNLLIPSAARTFGDITITSGVVQFWDPGSRVFSTLGRYDRLGAFLYIFLLLGVGLLYHPRVKSMRRSLPVLFALGLPALILTFSRASWFGFLLGFLFIGVLMMRDRRVMAGLAAFVIIVSGYLAITGLNVRFITEAPGQTLVERFYETFSYARWEGEYYGLGRTFWMVQTPLTVVPASPLFGFGPGQYGGGVVHALGQARVYEELGLPFGVYGTEGYIDNNWFSLWGEAGTIGLAVYIWIYAALFTYAVKLYRDSRERFVKAMAIGYAAVMIAVALHALLATMLEVRTVGFYLWLYGGFIFVLGERTKRIRAEKA